MKEVHVIQMVCIDALIFHKKTQNFQFAIIDSYTLLITIYLTVISFCDNWKFILFSGQKYFRGLMFCVCLCICVCLSPCSWQKKITFVSQLA